MSEIPGYTLEEYIEWNHSIINDELLALYEPYRESIENWLSDFDPETQSWRAYSPGCVIGVDLNKETGRWEIYEVWGRKKDSPF